MLNKYAKYILTTLVAGSLPLGDLWAQCAMCRATLENNVSHGDVGIGAGINFGIMYLFVTPYLAAAVVGYLWYKKSKANSKKIDVKSYIRRKVS